VPTTGPVSGRLFIWYPHEKAGEPDDAHIGHVSLYLGNYEVGRRFELALDPKVEGHVMKTDREKSLDFSGIHYNDNYVSWWPKDDNIGPAKPKLGLYADAKAEGGQPHVVYDLYGLDVEKMRVRWRGLRDQTGAKYDFVRRNCADIVHRVMVSGGAVGRLPFLLRGWHSTNAIATPKKVAQFGNALRDASWAIKTKAGNCPTKSAVSELLGPFAGLRGMLR
jgi:hypothetical protein